MDGEEIVDFIEKIPNHKIRVFAKEQYDKVKTRDDKISELQSEVTDLLKQLGKIELIYDTPSLNIVSFEKGQPNCSKHGAMNQYEDGIFRCVMCGVAVSLENRRVINKHYCANCGDPLDYEPDSPNTFDGPHLRKWVCKKCFKKNK